MSIQSIAWGDAATWFAGTMSALAVLIAVWSVRTSAKASDAAAQSAKDAAKLVAIEFERFASEKAERRSSQARLVVVGLGWRERTSSAPRQFEEQVVQVFNTSSEPVRDVVVEVSCGEAHELERPLGLRSDELDVEITPAILTFEVVQPLGLVGPVEEPISVRTSNFVTLPRAPQVTVSWFPRPEPFVLQSPATEEARDRLAEFPISLAESSGLDTATLERRRYEWFVDKLFRWRPEGTPRRRPQLLASEITLFFTDAHGVHWRRTLDDLTEVSWGVSAADRGVI